MIVDRRHEMPREMHATAGGSKVSRLADSLAPATVELTLHNWKRVEETRDDCQDIFICNYRLQYST